jgi:hypothetical protein
LKDIVRDQVIIAVGINVAKEQHNSATGIGIADVGAMVTIA